MVTLLSRTAERRLLATALVVGLVPGVGVADFLSGQQATFASFYMVPVALASWYVGLRAGGLVAGCCVLSGFVADYYMPGHLANHIAVEIWNAASRLVVYVFSAWLLVRLRDMLASRERVIAELQTALQEIRTLRGLLPICAWCKRIRDENASGVWKPVELYVAQHSEADFTHGICPDCAAKLTADAPSRLPRSSASRG